MTTTTEKPPMCSGDLDCAAEVHMVRCPAPFRGEAERRVCDPPTEGDVLPEAYTFADPPPQEDS